MNVVIHFRSGDKHETLTVDTTEEPETFFLRLCRARESNSYLSVRGYLTIRGDSRQHWIAAKEISHVEVTGK